MSDFRWYYSRDDENFNGGFATREEAIREGQDYWPDEPIYIIEAKKAALPRPRADDIVENWWDDVTSDDLWGEDIPEIDASPSEYHAMCDDLQKRIDEWFAQHADRFPEPWAFGESRNRERIDP